MKFTDGRWEKAQNFLFHITTKDAIRDILESDKDCDGSTLDKLVDLPIDPRWATCEPKDGGFVKGEDFVHAMYSNWVSNIDKYLVGEPTNTQERTKIGAMKSAQMAIAVYRNDSAYFERLGGMMSYLVANTEQLKKVKNVDQEQSIILESLHKWWKANDKRLRTKLWIDMAFRIVIKKYKTNMFYRRSINMCLIFIANNADHWAGDDTFNPNNWFPKRRGKFANAMHGWEF